jgi:HAD superfamily hydrolase (TIGR01509 family)
MEIHVHERAAIRGLIFDCDGVLVDTESPVYAFWRDVCAEHGCALPLETWVACIGGSSADFDPYEYLDVRSRCPVDRDAIRERERESDDRLIRSAPLLPGVRPSLDEARRLGLRLAVASNSSRRWVGGLLESTGIAEYFDGIVCREDAAHPKPHPAPYRRALALLGLEPHEAIAIEDSPNGVRAAKAAGIRCVAVPNVMTRTLPLDHADVRLTSLEELPLVTLLERVRTARSAS